MADNRELIAALDQRFEELGRSIETSRTETRQQIEALEERLGAFEERTDRRFQEARERTDQRFQEIQERTDQRFQEAQERTDQRFQEIQERTDQRFQEAQERTDRRFEALGEKVDRVEGEVRHAHVRIESLDGSVRQLAEGILGVNEKVDRLACEISRQFAETHSLIHLSHRHLDARLTNLEAQ